MFDILIFRPMYRDKIGDVCKIKEQTAWQHVTDWLVLQNDFTNFHKTARTFIQNSRDSPFNGWADSKRASKKIRTTG